MSDIRDNTFTRAELEPGSGGSSIIDTFDDIDVIMINLVAGREYDFIVRGSSSGGGALADPALSIFNEFLQLVRSDDDSGGGLDAQVHFTPSTSGRYYIAIGGNGGTGSYTVETVDLGPTLPGDLPDSASTQSTIFPGAVTPGAIDYSYDQDWHKLSVEAGVTYVVTLSGASSGAGTLSDPVLQLHNSFGALVAGNDDAEGTVDSRISFTAAYSGTYFISASGFVGQTGTYKLAVSVPALHDDLPEDSAYVLPAFGEVRSHVNFGGDIDTFQVDLASNQFYVWNLDSLSTGYDPILNLYDQNGRLVATNDDANGLNSEISFITSTSGTYFLEVSGFGSTTGAYSLSSNLAGTVYAGTSFDDYREGSIQPDELSGLGGNDTLLGGDGEDQLDGGADTDTLEGGRGNDTLIGGAGNDLMDGGVGNDVMFVDAAGDVVVERAGEGSDRVVSSVSYVLAADAEVETLETDSASGTAAIDLTGSNSANTIFGNAGLNRLLGEGGDDTLHGFGGSDYLVGGAGLDNLYGGSGDDRFYIGSADGDRIWEFAGEGYDTVASEVDYELPDVSEVERLEAGTLSATTALSLGGSNLDNLILGNAGDNRLRGFGGNDTLQGLGGDDYLIGDEGADVMYGGTGNDTYYVNTSDDRIFENEGAGTSDRVATEVSFTLPDEAEVEVLEAVNLNGTSVGELGGSRYANTITGDAGNNVLRGYGSNDTLIGHLGADVLIGDEGNDTMVGGAGSDTYYVDAAGDVVVEAAGEGNDRVSTSVSYALAADAEVETLEASSLGSTDALDLTGSNLVNTIIGNSGANVLDGKGGNDVLIGAAGADTFVFSTALGSGNIDRIEDFQSGTDKIALDAAIFSLIEDGALAAGAFVKGAAAQDSDDRIIYDDATGALFYDHDGTGAQAAVQFATLQPGANLTGSDFTLTGATSTATSTASGSYTPMAITSQHSAEMMHWSDGGADLPGSYDAGAAYADHLLMHQQREGFSYLPDNGDMLM